MFNLGIWEIIIIGVIALFVIGPERLPEVARKVARFMNDVKRTTSEFGRQFSDVKADFKNEAQSTIDSVKKQVKDEVLKQSGVDEIQQQLNLEHGGGHRDDPFAMGIEEEKTEDLTEPDHKEEKS